MGILTYIKIGAFVVLASAIAGAYWYFKWSQDEMAQLRENNLTLELAVKESEATVKALRDSMQEAVARFNATNQAFQSARKDTVRLRDKLGKHELGALAERKPGLVQNIVNKGTADVQRCFEILSGSPLTESERAATKRSEINTSCPETANPNYVGEE